MTLFLLKLFEKTLGRIWRTYEWEGIKRYFLWRGKRFSIFLHKIKQADTAKDPHDHPFDFWGKVLSGGYREDRYIQGIEAGNQLRTWVKWAEWPNEHMGWYKRYSDDIHHISWVAPNTWTLIITGPRFVDDNGDASWGFWRGAGRKLKSGVTYVPFKKYLGYKADDKREID